MVLTKVISNVFIPTFTLRFGTLIYKHSLSYLDNSYNKKVGEVDSLISGLYLLMGLLCNSLILLA